MLMESVLQKNRTMKIMILLYGKTRTVETVAHRL